MKPSKKQTINKIKIPQWICHKFKLHEWIWLSRNHSTISARCTKCGMNGVDYVRLNKRERT